MSTTATGEKITALYAGYSAKCERWSLGTCDNVYDGRPPCRICAFFQSIGYESFAVTSGGLRSWRPAKASNQDDAPASGLQSSVCIEDQASE